MSDDVIVVGAGLIGTMIALRLSAGGARVRVVDAAGPGAGASGTSFGWINASFYHDDAHHALRASGIAAYRRLLADYPGLPVVWQSCLWFEEQGAGLADMAAKLRALDYPVEHVSRSGFAALSPGVAAPDEALHFTAEGVADPEALNIAVAQAAEEAGAQFILGCPVTCVLPDTSRPSVVTPMGDLKADWIVVAAGTGAANLLDLPMLDRPGLLLCTQSLPPLLAHVLVAPEGEIKQDAAGHLVMPTVAGHQGDTTEVIAQTPDMLADAALVRLQARIPDHPLSWTRVSRAFRPMPQDGLPVIGQAAPGIYAAVMHSGVTLAALVGEVVAAELRGEVRNTLTPYRPARLLQGLASNL